MSDEKAQLDEVREQRERIQRRLDEINQHIAAIRMDAFDNGDDEEEGVRAVATVYLSKVWCYF